MKKRWVALMLSLSILLSVVYFDIPGTSAAENSVCVLRGGEQVSELTLRQDEKETLTAEARGMEASAWQWQLLLEHQTAVWVNIYDKTEPECEISYALLRDLLDAANSTYIRCAVKSGGETFYSDAVCLTVAPVYEERSGEALTENGVALGQNGILRAMSASVSAVSEVSEYVTVTIKYLDQSSLSTGEESAVYSPYTARLERGTAFTQSIVSPTFLGFAPYYDQNGDGSIDEDASTVRLDIGSVTEDVEIKVYYKPIEVNFAVRYFFQNINDDLYTEDVTRYHSGRAETGTIVSDENLRAWAGDTTGFEKMYHVPESVAADGSTVFECYYDRNYYLVQFDLDGGYGVEPIYARYGSSFIVGTPTKPGYTFLGWERLTGDTDGDGIPDTGTGLAESLATEVPAQRLYYRALWQADSTVYKVSYWSLVGDDKQYLGVRVVTGASSGDVVSGTDDLNTEYENVFRYEEHTHSEAAGCYGGCPYTGHVHDVSCYTTSTLLLASEQTNTATKTAFTNLQNSVTEPAEGNVYKYRRYSTTYYNFFYLGDTWYYLGTNTAYSGITVSISDPTSNGTYTYAAATATLCEAAAHTHTEGCLSCHKLEHTHTAECNPDPRYYEFVSADSSVTVEGDGSTIVNVYYKPREYTLRFIYARSKVGNDGSTHYYVVGGSTYAFGGLGVTNPADKSTAELLRQVPEGNWGEVQNQPEFYPSDFDMNTDTTQYGHNTYLDEETGYTYYYFYFTACYGENISMKWPIGVLEPVKIVGTHSQTPLQYAYFSAWNGEYKVKFTQDNFNGNQTVPGRQFLLNDSLLYDGKFEDSSVVNYLGFWDNGADIGWSVPKMYRYHLMLESSDGNETHDGRTYKEIQAFRTFDNASIEEQENTSIPGFSFLERTYKEIEGGFISPVTKETLSGSYDLYYWYTRNDYTLKYVNYENVLRAVTVPYETLFTSAEFDIVPDYYPPALEPGAYEFVGWYISPEREAGTEVKFDEDTMPAADVVWYAKWVPKKHTVNFFISYDDLLAYKSGGTVTPYKTFTKNHRTVIGRVANPTQTGDGDVELVFNGWFYLENGEKKAFSPLSMAVTGDMNVFADWSSSSPQPFRLQYVLLSDPAVKVAEDTEGYAYAGSTRTFTAKVGYPYNQLYADYNTGYYPTVASHSITMQYETNKEDLKSNTSTFYYVEAADIEYTVRYVNKETNTVIEEVIKRTSASVVTERFKAYENMVPDAFYKRLELSVVWDAEAGAYVGSEDNVVTFYYSPSETSAYYAVHFMMEKLGATDTDKRNYATDGSGGYEDSGTYVEGVGDIGSAVAVTPQTFAGFSLIGDAAVAVIDGVEQAAPYADGQYSVTVTPNGSELYIFYARQAYSYTVQYYRYNTTEPLLYAKTGTASFGSPVTETAPDIPDYTCVSSKTQTISIRDVPEQNTIVFYYAPVQYVAEYVAVPDGGGILSGTIEVIAGTDIFSGSVPTANPYYSFEGWYIDAACTQSASDYGTVEATTNRFIPSKDKLSQTERNLFYAKFVRESGDLTIVRANAENDGQAFVYEVKDTLTNEILHVTVVGNGSVTIKNLPLGEYVVTQQNGWSWRYGDAEQAVTHQDGNGTTARFAEAQVTDKWLNGNSPLIHNQRGSSE